MKKYKVKVIEDLFLEKIKEKDIDTHLATNLEIYLNKNYINGWDFVSLQSLVVEVKTSFLSKRKQVKKNVAIFAKSEEYPSGEFNKKVIEPNISLGPAVKKM